MEAGINAQLDLVEDEKLTIRISAIRGLEMICKHNPTTVRRIAELLCQLLVSEEKVELQCVRHTFASLFTIDPQASFLALFTSASSSADANVRAKGLEFLQAQLKQQLPAIKKDAAVAAGVCAGLKAFLSGSQSLALDREHLKFYVQTLIALCPHGPAANKIRADETLKAELANIAVTQAGLKSGSLDLADEAALKQFVAVQSVVSNLSNAYGVDTAPVLAVFFAHILPNLEAIQNAELRTQVLRAVTNVSNKVQPRQAQQAFANFYALFKKYVPTGEIVAKAPVAAAAAAAPAAAASDSAMTDAAPAAAAASSASVSASASASAPAASLNFAFAEVFVYLFHVLAAQAPSELRVATGIFVPSGQPGDFSSGPSALKDEFVNRVQYLLQQNASYKEQLHTVQRKLQEEIKAFNKKAAANRSAKPAAAAAAVNPAAAGQPVGPEKKVEAAPAAPAAAAAPLLADESALIVSLRAKLQSVNFAVRIAANLALLAKPLLDKPLPTFLAADKMNLSWREHKSGPQQQQQGAGAKPQGGAGQQQKGQQQQQQQKGGNKQAGGQQQSQQKGQKRKSVEPQQQQQQSQSNKKKQGGGGGQQQQQQSGSNKKQRQSQSNKGGNSNQNGGGRRRR